MIPLMHTKKKQFVKVLRSQISFMKIFLKMRTEMNIRYQIPMLHFPFKGTIPSRSEQTFNRAWNRCPSLRLIK